MLYEIVQITLCFSIIDRVLSYYKWEGVYYILHAIHNAIITILTLPDVVHTITDIHRIEQHSANWNAILVCASLHFYHTLLYWRTFRYDDWLHHGLMIGVALPLCVLYDTHTLIGMTFFFTTGLPGGIDYVMLALVKNGRMDRMVEKRINTLLNVWIRSPGCVAVASIGIALHASSPAGLFTVKSLANNIAGMLTFWNGQYFMRQVVENYAILKIEDQRTSGPKA